jgi:hypothetical protein
MKLNKIYLSAAILSLAALSSCNNDDDVKQSNTQLLTSHEWMISKAEMSYAGQTIDITSSWIDDCEKDNVLTFNTDGSYKENVGANDCSGDEVNGTGTWAWKSSESILSITIDGDADDVKVVALDSKTLKINSGQMEYDLNGDGIDDQNVELIITLKAK